VRSVSFSRGISAIAAAKSNSVLLISLSTSFSCFSKLRTSSKVTAVFDAIILP